MCLPNHHLLSPTLSLQALIRKYLHRKIFVCLQSTPLFTNNATNLTSSSRRSTRGHKNETSRLLRYRISDIFDGALLVGLAPSCHSLSLRKSRRAFRVSYVNPDPPTRWGPASQPSPSSSTSPRIPRAERADGKEDFDDGYK